MFKVEKQENEKYTITCHFFDKESHTNRFLYSAQNIYRDDVPKIVYNNLDIDGKDDWIFAILDNTNCPAYISDEGKLSAVTR